MEVQYAEFKQKFIEKLSIFKSQSKGQVQFMNINDRRVQMKKILHLITENSKFQRIKFPVRKITNLYELKRFCKYNQFQNFQQKMKYAIISNQKRAILLERVMIDKQSIKYVAEQLKIKFPSAKSIIRTYKKTGRIFNKKKARKMQVSFNEKKEGLGVRLREIKEQIKTNKNIENQEKSQKITTRNETQKKEIFQSNLAQYSYESYYQPLLSYSLLPQIPYYSMVQFSPPCGYYGNVYSS